MKRNKNLLLLTFLLITFSSCSNTPNNHQNENEVSVIVMSGQSNMEGITFWKKGNKEWLKEAFEELNEEEGLDLDVEPYLDRENGVKEIKCSYRGYNPAWVGGPPVHASNKEDDMAGKFLSLHVDMGFNENYFGPEIGLGTILKEKASEEKPIFLIKSSFSASCFSATDQKTWRVASDNNGKEGELWSETKEFIYNNLKIIEDEYNLEPKIKAWLWMQGERDADEKDDKNAPYQYEERMSNLIDEFREEFSDYSSYSNGNNIAFVDCTIYDGEAIKYDHVDIINQAKVNISNKNDNNYLVNASTRDEEGLHLEIGGPNNIGGADEKYHYTTKDMVRLGRAFGEILIDKNIIK